jgi:4-diphosphocytidyl-2-C-methyl-D-erythritol kinase
MFAIEICSMKVNLTLRVFGKRGDGLHDVHSLYWRVRSPEVIEITEGADVDRISVIGADIPEENILAGVCRYLRGRWGEKSLPPLCLRLFKHIPMGSGVGAGSGNAGALLRWFYRAREAVSDAGGMLPLGADVAFLASDFDLAFVGGAGEVLNGLNGVHEKLSLPVVFFFPEWSSNTREAYESLDQIEGRAVSSEAESLAESRDVMDKLFKGMKVGLLPNDFIQCFKKQEKHYNDLYAAVESSGALAWGLCGSGSACFALYGRGRDLKSLSRLLDSGPLSRLKWIRQVMFL